MVLAETVIVACSGMTIFEIVKSFLFPDLTLWQSHLVTIVFSGAVSVIAVLVVYRKQERLHRQLRAEMRERQRKDEALHHVHEELKEILESISDAFYAVDHEWRLTYINRRAEQLWGRQREELLGKCLWQEFPQALDSVFHTAHLQAVQEQRVMIFEEKSSIIHRWIDVAIYPNRNGVAVYYRDITARKQTEAALQESEGRFRSLFDRAAVPTIVQTPGGYFIQANHAACAFFGYSETKLCQKSLRDVTYPADLGLTQDNVKRLLTGASDTYQIEKRFVRPSGEVRWALENNTVLRDDQGMPLGLIAQLQDITARRQAEDELRQLHTELEKRVEERTTALISINAALQEQIAERRQAEQLASGQTAVLIRTLQLLTIEPTQLTIDTFLRHVLTAIAEQLQVFSVSLYLYDFDQDTAHLQLSYRDGRIVSDQDIPDPSTTLPSRFVLSEDPFTTHIAQTQTPLVIEEIADSPLSSRTFQGWAQRVGVRSVLATPLFVGNQLIGAMGSYSRERRHFSSEEVTLAQTLAHQAALALQITRLAEQKQHSVLLAERNRMAREIHDTLAQGFTGIVVQLEATEDILVSPSADVETALFHINRACMLARDSLAEARRSVWALRPTVLEQETLPAALSHLVEELTTGTALHAEFAVHGLPQILPTEIETDLFRISQEAMSNALKHAQAHSIQMTLTFSPQRVQLSIEDDGQGFDPYTPAPQGFGFISMRERTERSGGEFTLTSNPGHGTKVQVTLPLPRPTFMGGSQ